MTQTFSSSAASAGSFRSTLISSNPAIERVDSPDLAIAAIADLARAGLKLRHSIAAELAEFGVTYSEFLVLDCLGKHSGLRQQDIANQCTIPKGNVSVLVSKLAGVGLVVCDADLADQRAKRVSLTGEGRILLGNVMARRRTRLEERTAVRAPLTELAVVTGYLSMLAGDISAEH